jgi:hypothetical protein
VVAENRDDIATELAKIKNLLALLLLHEMQDASDRDKIARLSQAELTHAEIATLLGKTSQAVRQAVYEVKSGKAKRHK